MNSKQIRTARRLANRVLSRQPKRLFVIKRGVYHGLFCQLLDYCYADIVKVRPAGYSPIFVRISNLKVPTLPQINFALRPL
jgi:hypothetical protein